MQHREITSWILAQTYENYSALIADPTNIPQELKRFLCRHDHIPVWSAMDNNKKQAAIAYVYKKRATLELHSGHCPAWAQATAYFMLWDWFYSSILGNHDLSVESDGDELELDMFFDDMDFMSDTPANSAVAEMLGIDPEFNEPF